MRDRRRVELPSPTTMPTTTKTHHVDRRDCPTSALSPVQIIPLFDEDYCSGEYLDAVMQGRFTFNGETFTFSDPMDWLTNPSGDVEWHILLHKFYYAPGLARQYVASGDARYLSVLQALILSWIEVTPIGFIAADVTARRIQNWIYAWQLIRASTLDGFDQPFIDRFLSSLDDQTRYVLDNLAPARNHRTLELYAVFLTALAFPELPNAPRWRAISIAAMIDNIASDLLDDGVHCEQSSDYHHIVLRGYLLFVRHARRADIDLPSTVHQRIQAALEFAQHLHRPDGKIPALSDSDSRDYRHLLDWGYRLYGRADFRFVASAGRRGSAPATRSRVFQDSGYVILRSRWAVEGEPYEGARYLVFDAGPIGAGNHGHLDALSVELAAFGRPLIIDPGRYTYDEQSAVNWRARFRETRAHNTVCVDSIDQANYVQGPKRRKIKAPLPRIELLDHDLSCAHPYLHGRVVSPCYDAVHHRHLWFVDERYWIIIDRIAARQVHDYELCYQLTPEADGRTTIDTTRSIARIDSPGVTLVLSHDDMSVTIEDGFVSYEYGSKLRAPRIVAAAEAAETTFLSLIYPEDGTPAQISSWQSGCTMELTLESTRVHHLLSWNAESGRLVCRDGISTRVHLDRTLAG